MQFKGKTYAINPKATDLHVAVIYRAIGKHESGYLDLDAWGQIAKQLCFIVPGCDFAKYDSNTRDGELYLSLSELIEIMGLLKTEVETAQATPDEMIEMAEEISKLQAKMEALRSVR